MRVLLYCRVSTDEQERVGSIATQREELVRYCEREGLSVAGIYEDNGVSGSVALEHRPGGKALLEAVRRGDVQAIVVYKLDRLGREAFDVLAVVSLLRARGVRLLSPSEEYADTSAGSLYTGMRAVIAQFEKELIRERTIAGKNRKARNGGWWGGPCPLGYEPGEDFALVPSGRIVPGVEITYADVACRIFEWCGQDGASLNEIGRRLAALGVPPLRGKRWHSTVIYLILTNPTYRGDLVYGRSGQAAEEPVVLKVPSLVDDDLWHAAQKTLATNRARKSGRPTLIYELAGLLRCCHCGAPYTGGVHGGKRGGYPYYSCRNKGRCPNSRSIKKTIAEPLVWGYVEKVLREPNEVLDEIVQRSRGEISDEDRRGAQLQFFRDAVDAKADERQQVISLCTRRIITDEDLTRQLERISQEEEELARQMQVIQEDARRAALIEIGLSRIERALQRFRAGVVTFKPEARKEIMAALVDEIHVETTCLGDSRGRGATHDYHVTAFSRLLNDVVREVEGTHPCSAHLTDRFSVKCVLRLAS